MNIGVDIDGVLTDIRNFQIKKGQAFFNKELVNKDGFTIQEMFNCTDDESKKFWTKYLLEYSIFFGARLNASKIISEYKSNNKIFIITSRAFTNENNFLGKLMRYIVREWLKINNIPYDKIIYCGESKKDEIINNNINVMIEDNRDNAIELSNYTKVILLDQEYNRDVNKENVFRANDWEQIGYYLKFFSNLYKKNAYFKKGKNTGYPSIDKPWLKYYSYAQSLNRIPDLKQLEEVTKNNEITEQAYIDKSNFIFEMTQEVREPLSYIKNTSKELVDNDYKKEEYKEGLNYIYNASRQLDFVVNDVLNVSSLDVQKVKFLNNRYNLDMIYEDLIKRVESSISKNVEFRYNMPNNVPYLYGDNIKLKQVLYSILMNSVKKTEKGFIEFNIDTIEKYDVCRVIFRIIDSGVGIGIDKINEILSTTSELNKDDIVNLQKSEFNIELCQKIIKSLGGNLLIKSKLGKGTEVILTIDQKIYREKEDNFNLFNNYSNKRVLVVSQDKKVNEVIKKVFNESDINASYILYGADAVDRIKSGKKYDYIIIEDDMKEMSGYETLKRLKEINKFNVPCIVILDSNKENIKKHYIEDGFSDYILTSDLRNELKRIIEKY